MIPKRKINGRIRNIELSPLFEVGKVYDIATGEENENGSLRPEWNHCWLNWEMEFTDEVGAKIWIGQAESYPTIEKAKVDLEFLKSL